MIQIANLNELDEKNIYKLYDLIKPELDRKAKLYQRYTRKGNDVSIFGAETNKKKVAVPFEKYIVDIASGYLGGKEPTYEVQDTADEKKKGLIQKLLNKFSKEPNYKESMEIMLNYITEYNDDGTENYTLVKDILTTGSCYEILYENDDNEIVYSRVNPLQTQAIWDYSVPRNLIGVVQVYKEKDINGTLRNVIKLTDSVGTRVYKGGQGGSNSYEEIVDEELNNHNWKDVPFTCVELPDGISLFEPVIQLIDAYEQLIENTKETFNYNNDAKLKVTGYRPEQPLLIRDEKTGEFIENPDRIKEDNTLLNMKVFYTPDDGDIAWVEKSIEDNAIQNTLKTYIDLIMMNTGVPQTTDLGFTKADNASAIDRKFFSLEQTTAQAMQLLKMAYKRRWELVFDRLNIKGTNYDFRDITITLNKNLPANENEVVDMYMKLRGLISDETIIDRLPLNFDSKSEESKMEEQDEKALNKELNRVSAYQNFGTSDEEPDEVKEENKKINKETKEVNNNLQNK